VGEGWRRGEEFKGGGGGSPIPPALETSAARVPLEVPSIGALMMMGCWACGKRVLSLLAGIVTGVGELGCVWSGECWRTVLLCLVEREDQVSRGVFYPVQGVSELKCEVKRVEECLSL